MTGNILAMIDLLAPVKDIRPEAGDDPGAGFKGRADRKSPE